MNQRFVNGFYWFVETFLVIMLFAAVGLVILAEKLSSSSSMMNTLLVIYLMAILLAFFISYKIRNWFLDNFATKRRVCNAIYAFYKVIDVFALTFIIFGISIMLIEIKFTVTGYMPFISFLLIFTSLMMLLSRGAEKCYEEKRNKMFYILLVLLILFPIATSLGHDSMVEIKKPAIYLYPEAESLISVRLDTNGIITKSTPDYSTGWLVKAKPDGTIDNKYDYLFYEIKLSNPKYSGSGWVINLSEMDRWFDMYLINLGLNEKEKGQFKEYWMNNLPKAKYIEVHLLTDEYMRENMRLDISPKPDTIIRLNFIFKARDNYIQLREPDMRKKERKGFTVVEWGGAIIR